MAKELGVRIDVRVHPQAKRSRVAGMLGDAYKLDISAPASDGRANDACIELLSQVTGVPRRNVRLLKGQTSRSKVFEFEGLDSDELRRRLNQAI
jgi:uncharacterized protein (TIGR00251 family)